MVWYHTIEKTRRTHLGVIDQIQVDKLLQLNISRLHTIQDICEQHRHVLSDCHASNDLLDGINLDVLFRRVEFQTKFMEFSLFLGRKEPTIVGIVL